MAEIRIEQKQRSLMPWFVGLALTALLIIGLTLVYADTGVAGPGVPEVDKAHEKKKDETPRRLQQWADHLPEVPEAARLRAA